MSQSNKFISSPALMNEFFFIMCRLHLGLLEQDLAYRFQVTQSTESRVCMTWINLHNDQLSQCEILKSFLVARKRACKQVNAGETIKTTEHGRVHVSSLLYCVVVVDCDSGGYGLLWLLWIRMVVMDICVVMDYMVVISN